MTGRVQILDDVLYPDSLAAGISNKWSEWVMYSQQRRRIWDEVRAYIFATDTTQTSAAHLPWKNKTTIPKLCQIRDNVYSNYTAAISPKQSNIIWTADHKDSNSVAKSESITSYMGWAVDHYSFKHELDKCILDFIDCGDAFGMPIWIDQRVPYNTEEGRVTQVGYVGPGLMRISPYDIVFNPTAENFQQTPKIIRSLVSLGEVKEMLERMSTDDNREDYQNLWNYLKEIRANARGFPGEVESKDAMYRVDGFASFRDYLLSDVVEILTFYGDLYDPDTDTFLKNHVIKVVDRHKVIAKRPNDSMYGYAPIFHVAWRKRQDNLWGMGPLENLLGMQYRMDHVENMKADIMDLTTFPVQKVKGYVGDYTWEPFAKIPVGDDGDVEILAPDVQALQVNIEIQNLERLMEEMAGAPKEAVGFRTPGEKTKYEVQRLENAASRVFQNKIKQFEEQFVEPLLNAMLELARRNMNEATSIRVFDDEFKVATFRDLTVEDITGIGRIKPIGARHFAEQAELVQNLSNLSASGLWPVVAPHYSSIGLAKLFEEIFQMKDYGIVTPFVQLSEQADAARQANALEEQVAVENQTPAGIAGDDFDQPMGPEMVQGQPV